MFTMKCTLLMYVSMIFRRVYILVDVRRGLRDQDLDMMITLNTAAIPYQVPLDRDVISLLLVGYNVHYHILTLRPIASTC